MEAPLGQEQLLRLPLRLEIANGAGLDVCAFENPTIFAGGGIQYDQVLACDHQQFGPTVAIDVMNVQMIDVRRTRHLLQVRLQVRPPPDFEPVGANAAVADESLFFAVTVNVVEVMFMPGPAVKVAVPQAGQIVSINVNGIYESGNENVAPGAQTADVTQLQDTVGTGLDLLAVVAPVPFEDAQIAAAIPLGDIDDFGPAVAIDIADRSSDFVHGPVARPQGSAFLPHHIAVQLYGCHAVDLLLVPVAAGRHARNVTVAGLKEDGFQLTVAVQIPQTHSSVAETRNVNLIGETKWTCHWDLFLMYLWDSSPLPSRIWTFRHSRRRANLAFSIEIAGMVAR